MNDDHTVTAPVIKAVSAWAVALGLTSWGEFASFLAACYTALLIGEWFWKKYKKFKFHGK